MENFEGNHGSHNSIKEKSVYLLHLDTPRIIIISSIVVGIIVASFLFGMNYIKDGDKSIIPIAGDNIMMKNNLPGMMNGGIPGPPDGGETLNSIDEKNLIKDKDMGINSGIGNKVSSLDGTIPENNMKNESVDILTNENINIIKPEQHKKKIKSIAKSKRSKTTIVKRTRKVKKQTHRKKRNVAVRKRRSNSVVAVVNRTERVRYGNSPFYAIQIASYDRMSKASREKRKLKSLKYKSYIDKRNVNGRLFYRVRVGPISSKRKAINMLNDIQEISRYQSCYMIKE